MKSALLIGRRGAFVAVIVAVVLAAASYPGVVIADAPSLKGTVAKFILHDVPRDLPAVSFQDGDGKERTLEDFRGKVVLLNLWATWCAPCVKEMPTLDRLQAKLGGGRFEVMALSMDRGGARVVKPFFEKTSVTRLAVYVDPTTRIAPTLGARGLPTTLLLDGEGREIGRLEGDAEWDAPETVALIEFYLDRKG